MQIEIDAAEKTQLTIWEIRINLLLEFEIIWIGPLVDQKWARAKHCAIHTRHNCVRIRCGFETRRAVIASSLWWEEYSANTATLDIVSHCSCKHASE